MTKLELEMGIRRAQALAISGMPLEHQLRASVALQRKGELETAQQLAAARGAHGRVVELEAAIELMESELESLGVVLAS